MRAAIKKQGQGFTIVELMIASAVFSLVLVAALAGFLQIGRMFYKGVSITQTQETASQIINDVTESISAASVITSGNYDTFTYFCAGNVRYTYNIGSMVDSTNTTALSDGVGYGLIRDTLPGGGACAPPCPTDTAFCTDLTKQVPWNEPVEMLGDKMRVQVLTVQPNLAISDDFYTVEIVVAYGDDHVLEYTDTSTPPDPATVRCRGGSSTQQFCAVSRYSSSVKRGVSI